MLILRRKEGQQFVINKTIIIGVSLIGDHYVELAIEAPGVMPIKRNDVWVDYNRLIEVITQRQQYNQS